MLTGTVFTFRPGPATARSVYRTLRRLKLSRPDDVVFSCTWPVELENRHSDSFDAVLDAVWDLDLRCKTLNTSAGVHEMRTRSWFGHGSAAYFEPQYHPPRPLPRSPTRGLWRRDYLQRSDRWRGMRYARLLAALLRTAHRHGVDLLVEVVR